MLKIILKETIITLLLCIAILLILGVLFYDYNPLNKIVPNKISYTVPEEIKNDIQDNEVKDFLEGGFNLVYSIDSSDLNIYKKENSYVAGKENPFSEEDQEATGNIVENGNNDKNNNVASSNNANNTNRPVQNAIGRK